MCLFIESIRLENNTFLNLDLHSDRMNRTRYDFFKSKENIDLKQILFVDKEYLSIHRVRITYNEQIRNIEIAPYYRRQIRNFRIIFY